MTVTNLNEFKNKKKLSIEISKNRTPLDVSHLPLNDRISKIRISLERINNLMEELKKMSEPSTKGTSNDK